MTTEWLDLPAPPGLAGFFIRSALRRKMTGRELPNLGVRCPVTVDAKHLERYRSICGFTDEHHLPATYPHLLTFPLQMQLLTDKRFPFPLLGLVHVENRIRVVRPLAGLGPFTLSVQLQDLQPHSKGVTFSALCQLHDQLDLLWEGDSRYLCRAVKPDQQPAERTVEEPLQQSPLSSWNAPANIGRRYARIAGDYNPIHMFGVTAKLFGFPRAIAHGLWNKGRALAELDKRLPKAGYEVGVRFQKPVLLPSQVHLHASDAADSGQFSLTGDKGQSHFSGYWRIG